MIIKMMMHGTHTVTLSYFLSTQKEKISLFHFQRREHSSNIREQMLCPNTPQTFEHAHYYSKATSEP